MAPLKRKSDAAAQGNRLGKKQKVSAVGPSSTLKEDAPFPRGGASLLTPLEHKQIKIQAKQDILFEQTTGKKASKNEYEDEDGDSEGFLDEHLHAAVEQKPKKDHHGSRKIRKSGVDTVREDSVRIESLSYKRLVPGSIVLGQVSKINRDDIALSLPNNLTGFIPLTSISTHIIKKLQEVVDENAKGEEDEGDEENDLLDLSKFFNVGRYLRAAVVSTGDEAPKGAKGKRHIELSIRPYQANAGLKAADLVANSMVQAAVRSVEDHGLIMDLGLEDEGVRGFMSSKELGPDNDFATIQEGSVQLCLVTGQSSNGRTVKLSLDPQKISNFRRTAFVTDAPSVESFLPGTAVDILVSEVTSSGVHGKIMGLLDVTADIIHSGSASSNKELDKRYPVGSKAKGRILCTFPTSDTKKLGVTFQDHILYWRSKTVNETTGDNIILPATVLPASSVIDQAKVAKVEPGSGLYLDVGVKGVRGFAHISKLSDSRVEALSESTGPYKVGSLHKARVISYNPIDGLFILSLEPSVINQSFLNLEDVKVGQLVKATIQKLLVNAEGVSGAILDLAKGITGLVPDTHFSDVRLQHPERKFKEGMAVTGRVLSVDPLKGQIRLTLKKSLVNSDVEQWTSYEGLKIGMQGPGTLISILPNGAVVQFYGIVRAFLPISEMSESFIQDPKEHFQKGQVVNVHITSIDPEQKRMTVSCKDPSMSGDALQQATRALGLGEEVSGNVTEKTKDEIIIELKGSGLRAMLRYEHLVDGSAKKAESTAKRIRVGQVLKNLIVLSKSDTKGLLRLTGKPSLVEAAKCGKLLKTIGDVTEGIEVHGYVNNITSTGVFVRFAGELTGLLLKQHLGDVATNLPDFGLRRDQSISSKVLSLDQDQGRFLLSMRPVECLGKDSTLHGAGSKANTTLFDDIRLSNPVDKTSMNIEDFTIGKLTAARVMSVKKTQMNVQLADGVQGRIDVSEIFDTMDEVSDRKHPLKKFRAKMVIQVRILGMHDQRNHRFLPISHRQGRASVFELTAKPSNLDSEQLDILTIGNVKVGSAWLVTVNNVTEDCLWVNLSPNVRGRIRAMDVSDDVSLLRDLAANFPIGSVLKAKVLKVDAESNRLDLTARSSGSSNSLTLEDLSLGMVLPGRVTKISDRQVMVQLSENVAGAVHLVDMADDFSKADPKAYQKNETIRVCVKDVDRPNGRVSLSTRPSRILSSSLPIHDKDIASISELKINDVMRGFIKNVADNGIFVSLASNITAFVRVSDLSDLFIKDWKSGFEVDRLVEGKIVALDPLLNHVQMSLKKSLLDKDYQPPLTFADMKVGQTVTGRIRKVEDYGVFVVVDNSANVSGLCHKSKMSNSGAEPRKLFEEGDAVQAKILNINTEKRQISFGLKPSYFDNPKDRGKIIEEEDLNDLKHDDTDVSRSDDGGVELEAFKNIKSSLDDVDDVGGSNSNLDMDIADDDIPGFNPQSQLSSTSNGISGLSTGKIDWTGGMETFDDAGAQSDISDAKDSQHRKKKTKKTTSIQVDKTGSLDANGPQNIDDFERLLLSQPNSSHLWLRYMAFHLSLDSPSTARSIAERALKTINIVSTDEKLNIWTSLLNLETTYGDPTTLADVFTRACQYNDSLSVHERLTSIHIQAGQLQQADTLFQTTLKKFPATPFLYLNYATFLMSTLSSPDRARALLPRAMQSLPSHTHLALTSKFAQLEFKHGAPERGRTLFEQLLAQWPKRLDLWNVLIDMEISLAASTSIPIPTSTASASVSASEVNPNDNNNNNNNNNNSSTIRNLFERITSPASGLKLKPRKAKFFFKRWLAFEAKVGDAATRARVERLAGEFVERFRAAAAAAAVLSPAGGGGREVGA